MAVCSPHLFLLEPNFLVIKLERFSGEPDGGLTWPNESLPFALIEVGVSDSGKKTRGCMVHWLTKGHGKVYSGFVYR